MLIGLDYTYSHWAFDVVICLIYNLGGFTAIHIATIILAIIINLILFILLYKRNKAILPAFIVTLTSLFLSQNAYTARSQIVSFLCFIIEIYCIEKFIETNQKKYAGVIIVLSIVVANFHAATWPLILVLFLPYVACEFLNFVSFQKTYERKIKKLEKKLAILSLQKKNESDEYKKYKVEIEDYRKKLELDHKPLFSKTVRKESYNGKNLIILMVIVLFTGLITPIHGVPYTYIYNSMFGESNFDGGETSMSYVAEMQATIPAANLTFLGFTIIFIAFLAFMPGKLKAEHGFLMLGLYLMSIVSSRYSYLLVFLGAYVLCDLITQAFNMLILDDTLAMEKFLSKRKSAIILILLSCLVAGVYSIEKIQQDYVDESSYPVSAVNYIKENIDYKNMRIFNSYNNGSYLMLNDIPVFIDSRLDVYCSEFNDTDVFKDFVYVYTGKEHYEDIFEKYDFTHILLYKDELLNTYVSRDENYTLLYEDEYFVLYERNV